VPPVLSGFDEDPDRPRFTVSQNCDTGWEYRVFHH